MVSFVNSFLSYLILFLVIALIAGCAVFIGITLRKNKNKKAQEFTGEKTEGISSDK